MAENNDLTVNQLAERWDVTRKTLENYRKQGFGPVPELKRVGATRRHELRYPIADVVAHEKAHGITPKVAQP